MGNYNLIRIAICLCLAYSIVKATTLEDYVYKLDPNYQFKVLDYIYAGPGYTMYAVNMTSQKWLTSNPLKLYKQNNFNLKKRFL